MYIINLYVSELISNGIVLNIGEAVVCVTSDTSNTLFWPGFLSVLFYMFC